ncbi:asparagine synthase (glutamine-hydrolyzing) [Oceanobacillus salinisoli]|uniref:asparagine synthase (glutamine-hydrolyzing) n=1 Tax=Oceanobacillus salinisoli TaxID=2678611 RepID=UPI0012E1C9BB|nr:asparagine synthase (glutamine-hydrolyzing) [Oceanobacillus salinisoli]
MCGINGLFQYTGTYKTEQISTIISKMNNRIIHRGPDDNGVFVRENIGLGMRRLSIIDLENGKQPIFNESKSLVIVFNGEIYNYKSLKQDLLSKGHKFYTTSDTEVALHCYEEYGVESFNKLKGMFAFAIYDLENEKVTIVRDRAGEKPLYYYKNSEMFLFASELKSLVDTGIINKKIDRAALEQYLQLTYIPAPLTIFENVYKLMPGHYMVIDCRETIEIKQYWDVKYNDDKLITDYEECKKELRNTLFNAVEQCMVSDVPVGTFLSGGIDSTIITGIVSQISDKPIDTFTIGYKDKQFDESNRAKLSSDLHKTKHHVFYLKYEDALPELDKILNNIDEPFADSSYIPTYMVSKYASKYVKTVLTGDSGDELFGGYSKYLIGYYSEKYNKIPKWVQKNIIKKAVYALPDNTSIIRKARKVIDNADNSIFEQRKNLMCLGFKKGELTHVLKDYIHKSDHLNFIQDYYMQNETDDELSRALYTDFKVVLEGDMLPKVDRASMLSSLETRVPMLHKDVIELAAKIPSMYKINSKNTKIILKETFKDLIPKELLYASKSGFGVPIGKWFQNELKEELLSCLNKDFIEAQGIFDYDYIQKILNEHFSLSKNRSSELWVLYVFQSWYMKYFN